ncbi:MAG: cytochrome c [Phycisphaerales bacterium]|nr:MAG: cytochrome c [Phycisphaerales bacterium]
MSTTTQRVARVALAAALCAGVAGALTGCRGDRSDKPPRQFFPDMDDQPKYKSQAESNIFRDRRTMREPVAGTVAFARTSAMDWADGREDLLREDDRVYRGVDENGEYVVSIPLPVDDAFLRRGRERYEIFCMVCHNANGDGKGPVGNLWSYPLPNFHDEQFLPGGEQGSDGYIFHVIRNGVPNAPGMMPALRMPAYRNQINERDAWAIVAYVRALQLSRAMPLQDVPSTQRRELERTRGAAPRATQEATQ